ncbi:hypothetical protein E6W39_29205 [Kitasatospora acidiphila]|uniref:DUF3168 domain-containing protein n=1 Tax=Kitasatospora acidiphila TaxID=2567942 RepID=A0A540W976_9ACTN|nr:hypothetical protein [Kitasatospora acidiphila]TQF05563.1 hypothetical protein E6W39_29205 [Kitasatospora acidiphila]
MAVSGRVISLAVQAALASATGRSCGYGAAPLVADKPTGNTIPYCVLYPLGTAPMDGPPFGDADADAKVLVQVTSIGSTAEQAEWMADKVRTTLLGRTVNSGFATPITPTGFAVMGRELDKSDGISVVSGVYSYVERFALHVTTPGS